MLLFPLASFAQKDTIIEKNEMNVELLGSGVIYSVNYERLVYKIGNFELKGSLGFHFNPIIAKDVYDYRSFAFLVEPKVVYSINRHSMEIGLGYSYIYLYDNYYEEIFGCCSDLSLLIPRLGYRLYSKSQKNYWGISFTPLIGLDLNEAGDEYDNGSFIPFAGLKYGWRF